MVVTNKLYSPQDFVEILTGKYYIFDGDDDFDQIHAALVQNGIESLDDTMWDYPLNEIDHIVDGNLNVVLVKGMVLNEDNELEYELRWFEIPAECVDKFLED